MGNPLLLRDAGVLSVISATHRHYQDPKWEDYSCCRFLYSSLHWQHNFPTLARRTHAGPTRSAASVRWVSPSVAVKQDFSLSPTRSPDADRNAPGTRIVASHSSALPRVASTFVNRVPAASMPSAMLVTDVPYAVAHPDTLVIRSVGAGLQPIMLTAGSCPEDLQRSATAAAISTVR